MTTADHSPFSLEFGHNWGSEHDPPKPECTPASGAGGGNFIMYAYANQGHERNNNVSVPTGQRGPLSSC